MGKSLLKKPYIIVAILAVASAYLFFFRLGGMTLTDPDETFYAQTAREMTDRGEWHTPYLYGKPQFEKPILFYWLVEASFKAFGVNEFAARFPSAVFGFFGLVGTYLLGGAIFNRRAGLLSAAILATNIEYIILARACVTDMVLAVFVEFAFLFFIYGYNSKKRIFYAVSSVFAALAVLTKGPVGVMLPAAVILLYLIIKKDLGEVKRMPIFLMVSIIAVIALPWYILMYRLHGKPFIDMFFGYHNVTRFLVPEHKSGETPFYYLAIIFGGFFPWSVFLPFGLWESFKKSARAGSEERVAHLFLLLWIFVFLIFFSVSSTKLPTYIFPIFPAMAIMVGRLWDGLFEKGASSSLVRGMAVSQWLLFAATILAAIGISVWLAGSRYAVLLKGAAISSLVITGCVSFSLSKFILKRYRSAFCMIAASVVLTLPLVGGLVIPEVELHDSSKQVAEKLKSLMKPGEKLGGEPNYLRGLAFYTGQFPKDLGRHHDQTRFLDSPKRVWCVLKDKNHAQLYTLTPYYSRPTYLVWRFGKKCIVTNIVPDDGVYLEKREYLR